MCFIFVKNRQTLVKKCRNISTLRKIQRLKMTKDLSRSLSRLAISYKRQRHVRNTFYISVNIRRLSGATIMYLDILFRNEIFCIVFVN